MSDFEALRGRRGSYIELGGGWILSVILNDDGDCEVKAENEAQDEHFFVGTLVHDGEGWLALLDDGEDSGLGLREDRDVLACDLHDRVAGERE